MSSKVLKIESVGKEPILIIENVKKKVPINTSEANLKRLESLKNLKKGYLNQKSLIQAALANIDTTPKNKIIFDNDTKVSSNSLKSTNDKKTLFQDEDSGDEFEPSFSVKEHFQGKQGQKLMELQSKYKNDKRFTLDERFLEEENELSEEKQNLAENAELSLEEEKQKEFKILEEVLGKNLAPKENIQSINKKMLRYDPSQPDHLKYELQQVVEKKAKRRRKNSDVEIMDEKKQEEKDAPEVSKEVFFKISDNLKQTFEEKKEFSLLSMFGQVNEEDKTINDTEETLENRKIVSNNFLKEKNPFRYDSSDDEDEIQEIPDQNKVDEQKDTVKNDNRKRNTWTDPFFFKSDDYRLQEGFDFVEKMKSEKTEFTKLRRDLKEIVKAKVRNNLRKNKPFKKKLGGSKKKKILRMKKALKR